MGSEKKTERPKPMRLDDLGAPDVENLPSVEGKISALASAGAPFIYFDEAPFCAYYEGVGSITVTASRQIAEMPGQRVAFNRVITGLLRANVPALLALRDVIDKILNMATPAADNGGLPN